MKTNLTLVALFLATLFISCNKNTKTELFNGNDLNGWTCVLDQEIKSVAKNRATRVRFVFMVDSF